MPISKFLFISFYTYKKIKNIFLKFHHYLLRMQKIVAQHENGDLRKIKVCVNFPRRVKVCKGKFTRSALKGFVKLA